MLHIHLFGYLRLINDGQPFPFRGLPKTISLLSYLLLKRKTAVSREHLAYFLWDDVSEDEARANLRRHLHDLIRRLPPGEEWVLRDRRTIQWNPAAPFWLDIAEFERLAQDKERLSEELALYSGELLQGSYEDWIIAERERFQALHQSTLADLIVIEREKGNLEQAILYAQKLLNLDPLREDIVRTYMSLRHAIGDRAGALQLYQQFKVRLAEELGVEPMVETADLYQRLSSSKTPSTPSNAVPIESPPKPHSNLPARLTSFIGRQEELAEVCHQIAKAHSPIRLLTITGPGGTGKTRLALEVGRWLAENRQEIFPDGIFLVELASLISPDRMVPTIVETLSLKVKPNQSALETLISDLSEKRLLLLLDNFEHLLEQAANLADLLTAVPDLTLLVTSQTPLHLYGEHEYPLSPLPLPQPGDQFEPSELLNFAAVQLLTDRLQAVQPRFRLTAENSETIIDICRCLDGMPLALELAAARGKLFTPKAMLEQLSQRLPFLTSQTRNRPDRHQTLRATIDWSYNLLQTAEQSLFAGTALFAGSFTVEAAQGIFADTEFGNGRLSSEMIPNLLYALVDKNMIGSHTPEGTLEPRFVLLQTLREYGQEKLMEFEQVDALRQQFANYYVSLAEQGDEGLKGAEQSRWIQLMQREESNFIVALDWLLGQPPSKQNALLIARFVIALARFWIIQGWVREMTGWLEQARSTLAHLPMPMQVRLLNELGNAHQTMGDFVNGEAAHREALAIARQTEQQSLIAHTLHFLAFTAGRQGHYSEAKQLFNECLPHYRQLPEVTPIQITRLLNNLAIVYKRLGEYGEAIKLLEESLALKRDIDDALGLPASLTNLGNLLILQGNPAAAIDYIHEALKRRQEMQDRQGMLLSLNQMATLAVALGEYGRAATLYTAADSLHQSMAISRAADGEEDKARDMEIIQQQMEPEELAASQAAGKGLSLEEACDLALS